MHIPVKNVHKKERRRTRSKKVTALFLRKKSVPTKVERVPKWNDQERIPLFLECVLNRFIFWNASFLPIVTFPTKVL
jgi:hypothetical protein